MRSTATIKTQPYLNYNEQKSLEEVVHKIPSMFPMINRIVLYGSKVRGDFIEESDIDILFITDNALCRKNKFEIYDTVYEIEVRYDVIISVVFISTFDFQLKEWHFLRQVKTEGVTLWSKE